MVRRGIALVDQSFVDHDLGGWPKPGLYNPLDQSDDFFRLRLICTILETCGMYYEKGAAKKRLDFFLTFFQVCALIPKRVDH